MAEGKTLERRLQQILKEWIDPYLKSLGFMKRSFTYTRPFEELYWLLNIQRSQWNTSSVNEFTLNLGVYVPGVNALLSGNEPKYPAIYHCVFHLRLGELAFGHDHWWVIRSNDSDPLRTDRTIGEEIKTLLEQHAIPFLGRFQTIRDVTVYLEELGKQQKRQVTWPASDFWLYIYLGILYWMMGNQEMCCIMMDKAFEEAKTSRVEGMLDIIQSLYNSLCNVS